jgi:hypothetical protein
MSDNQSKINDFSKKVEFYFNTLLRKEETTVKVTYEIYENGEKLTTVYLYIEFQTYWDGDDMKDFNNYLKNIESEIYKFFNTSNRGLTNIGDYLPYDKIASDKIVMNIMGPVLYDIKWNRGKEELVLSYDVMFED